MIIGFQRLKFIREEKSEVCVCSQQTHLI